MRTIRGPALFLAQFAGDRAPFDSWDGITRWAADCGYVGVQVPSAEARLFDLDRAAASRDYCDELAGRARENGVELAELAAHLEGQLLAVHPAYDAAFDGLAPPALRGDPKARQDWAADRLRNAIAAARHLGLPALAAFSGGLAWPFLYPWPPRPPGLIDTAFDELARRWWPILDHADENGIDIAFELHPGTDLFDGACFERFLDRLDGHPRCCMLYDPSHYVLQALDYLEAIDIFHDRIRMLHVKDAELNPTGRQGVYGGYAPWIERAGRFRSPGDGQVDFGAVFSKLAAHDFPGWATVEWECAIKHPEQGAREGAEFVRAHLIRVAEEPLSDTAGNPDEGANRRMLGIA